MNLIFLSLISQSQQSKELKFVKDHGAQVAVALKKWWEQCTPKVAPSDGQLCICSTNDDGTSKTCNSKQICYHGQCKDQENAVRKKCTSLDRCVAGQGQCTGSHACYGDLICGERSCGVVRAKLFKESIEDMFEKGYVAGVTDPTAMHENNHCCCERGDDCKERTLPFLQDADCSEARQCRDPYECNKIVVGVYVCQMSKTFEKKFKELGVVKTSLFQRFLQKLSFTKIEMGTIEEEFKTQGSIHHHQQHTKVAEEVDEVAEEAILKAHI